MDAKRISNNKREIKWNTHNNSEKISYATKQNFIQTNTHLLISGRILNDIVEY